MLALSRTRKPERSGGYRASAAAVCSAVLTLLLCCRGCQAPLRLFLPCLLWALWHLAPSSLAASLGVGTSRLQRPATFYNHLFAQPNSRQIASMGSAARARFTAS